MSSSPRWKRLPIGQVADVVGGGTPSTKDPTNFGGEIPWITPRDLSTHFERYIEGGERSLSKKGYDSSSARLLPSGTVLLSSRAPIGYVAIAQRPVATNQGFRSLVLKEGHSPEFFYYLLKSMTAVLESRAGGTTFKEISGTTLKKIEVPVPQPSEQRSIARVLGALDDKIELNRQMNRTLESLAQAIFRSWFVDFDPVVAKADGREPYGMSDKIAALFPDRFVDSELGPIPEGWKVASVADIADYVNGRNFTKNATGSGRMVIRISELNSGPSGSTVYNEVETEDRHTAYPDNILFAWSGSLGVYRWHRDAAIVNQHIFKVTSDQFPCWFVYYQLLEALPFFRRIAADKATTMGHIRRGHLDEAELAVPPGDVIETASEVIGPLYQLIHESERESQTLADLRDTLLPKLLSGEIRVPQAEEAVASA